MAMSDQEPSDHTEDFTPPTAAGSPEPEPTSPEPSATDLDGEHVEQIEPTYVPESNGDSFLPEGAYLEQPEGDEKS